MNITTITWRALKKQKVLLLMSVPIMLYIFLFSYVPLWGWLMAFKDYRVGTSLWSSDWVGLDNFTRLLSHPHFVRALRNNVIMNLMLLISSTVCSIGLAVLLNELRNKYFVRSVQTLTYLPHFVSMVVIANISVMLLSPDDGLINVLLIKLGVLDEAVFFLSKGEYFWILHTIIMTWQGFGWGAIIYLAAMAGVDPTLYEAAEVDGSTRWQRVKYITIPSIMPIIVMLLILNIGGMLTRGFESQFLLGNAMTYSYSEVISILALRVGISEGDFSFGTAVGIFDSVVCITLLMLVNRLGKRFDANLY